jgi:xyloglucan-specific endo-beta-1,4-glucanase
MKLMPSFSTLVIFLLATPLVTSAVLEVEKRALYSTCDTWGTITEGSFTVYQVCGLYGLGWMHPLPPFCAIFADPDQNLFGASSASSGSQCLNLNSYYEGIFSWNTTWTWAGAPFSVK